jgi:hypothetical protein
MIERGVVMRAENRPQQEANPAMNANNSKEQTRGTNRASEVSTRLDKRVLSA